MASSALPTTDAAQPGFGRPQLIYFCELAGPALRALLAAEGLLPALVAHRHGVAVALRELDEDTAESVRVLNRHQVPVVAWLLLPPGEGFWFNLQNYPQAIERYRAFAGWARAAGVRFQAIGLDVEPPTVELDRLQRWGARELARRLWLARENVLFAAARAAYTELIAEIHHDGYEVHTYQLPILADDRRAGTTLAQRALDIVDLPADLEVLICYSSVPIEAVGNDLGGALITSYGPAADAIGVGTLGGSAGPDAGAEGLPPLTWDALERDLLLAAHHTDTIYVYSLEGCVERGLLPRLTAFDWDAEARPVRWKRALVGAARALILVWLLCARFSRVLFAWLGWGLFALLLARRLRAARPDR
ncbi:MAG TPA: hypothetical protein PKD53_05780 [Chloroflexaceae bacterium]|nr:hypothetical protein [Chloroflexaceae bacterium]